jgi:hypothetical protein
MLQSADLFAVHNRLVFYRFQYRSSYVTIAPISLNRKRIGVGDNIISVLIYAYTVRISRPVAQLELLFFYFISSTTCIYIVIFLSISASRSLSPLSSEHGDRLRASIGGDEFSFLICIVGRGVQLGPLGTAATNWPLVPAPGEYDGEIGGMIGRGNSGTRRKPAPVSLYPPEAPHAARTPTRAAAVGSQRLTA